MRQSVDPLKNISALQDALLSWFSASQRKLPWRQNYHPYHVWISEIMGQQTQMERVVEYFSRWIEQFPAVSDVATAGEQQILKAWEGLGYYSRARNIHRAAKILVEKHESRIPENYDQLLALPGIGPYTAAAILSIAYNQDIPLIDANVERLFTRLLDISEPVKSARIQAMLRKTAQSLLVCGKARMFNQALMECGALICKPGKPDCQSCFLAEYCLARQHGTVLLRPVRAKNDKRIDIDMACAVIIHQGLCYIQQRAPDDVWGSLWEFPGGRLKNGEIPEQAALREVKEETEFVVENLQPLGFAVHHYTKYRVTLHGFTCSLSGSNAVPVLHAAVQYRWLQRAELVDFPFPAGHRQLVKRLVDRLEAGFTS